jgi:hypothetical protein
MEPFSGIMAGASAPCVPKGRKKEVDARYKRAKRGHDGGEMISVREAL